jgi:putative hemolysin
VSDAPLWLWAGLGSLLVLSGLFSSSETALFSLTPSQRERAGPTARRLLADPSALLVSVLLANLVVNLLFFSFVGRLMPGDGGAGDVAVGLGALVCVLVVGEILPKVVGLRSRVPVGRMGAVPLAVLVQALGPVRRRLAWALERVHLALSRWVGEERALTPDALAKVLERGAEEGLLLDHEANLLAEVLELGEIRVREIMTPRVDALFLDVAATPAERESVVRRALDARQSWLPVVHGTPDEVLGRVRLRDVLTRPAVPLRRFVMPVKFVPEVASALALLHGLRADRATEAVVVDEWGGTAGYVTLEDVFEEIVGEMRVEGEQRQRVAVPLGEGRYRVAGSLSIRDWNEAFGFDVVPTEFETVGGFVTALLGRIPRAGDEVRWGELVMEVHVARGRRVLEVDLRVAEPERDRTAAGRETA